MVTYKITFNGRDDTCNPEAFKSPVEAWRRLHSIRQRLANNITHTWVEHAPGIPSEEMGLLTDKLTVSSVSVVSIYRIEANEEHQQDS